MFNIFENLCVLVHMFKSFSKTNAFNLSCMLCRQICNKLQSCIYLIHIIFLNFNYNIVMLLYSFIEEVGTVIRINSLPFDSYLLTKMICFAFFIFLILNLFFSTLFLLFWKFLGWSSHRIYKALLVSVQIQYYVI